MDPSRTCQPTWGLLLRGSVEPVYPALLIASADEEPKSDDRLGINYGNERTYLTKHLWADADDGLSLSNLKKMIRGKD